MATCPECDAEVIVDEDDLEEMELGDPWDCEACGSRLRVAGLDPLDFEGDDEEDDEDEDEDEDDKDWDE
jgi:lysine biosynthesis protein LysW